MGCHTKALAPSASSRGEQRHRDLSLNCVDSTCSTLEIARLFENCPTFMLPKLITAAGINGAGLIVIPISRSYSRPNSATRRASGTIRFGSTSNLLPHLTVEYCQASRV